VSGLVGGNKAVKSAGQAFKRGFGDGAARSAMDYIYDTALAGNASGGRRSAAGASMAATGVSAINRDTGSGRDPRSTCGTGDAFSGGIGSQGSRGYQQTGDRRRSGTKSGFSLGGMLKSAMLGGLAGGLMGTAMYGTGKALDAVAGSIVAERRGSRQRITESESGLKVDNNVFEQIPSRRPQYYTSDLSQVTGKSAKARQKAIDAILKEDFPDLNLTYKPEYSPFIRTGIAQQNTGTQIGKNMFVSRNELRDTIIHEELHHRWWKRGIYDHHPIGTNKEELFYGTIRRYKEMRGWNNE